MENHDEQFTVLLVEDDLNDIFLVTRAFKKSRSRIPLRVVTDGAQAIQYLRGEEKYADREAYPLPRLIVMDIKMPRQKRLRRPGIAPSTTLDFPAHPGNHCFRLGPGRRTSTTPTNWAPTPTWSSPWTFTRWRRCSRSITHYWGLECAKPDLELAGTMAG